MSNPSLQADLTLTTRCGIASHEIVYRVTVYGHVVPVFNPCEHLPFNIRRLVKSNCQSLVHRIRSELQCTALPTLAHLSFGQANPMSDIDPCDELRDFILHIHQNKFETASSVLVNHEESSLLRALDHGLAVQQWAAATIAQSMQRISPKLRSRLRSLSNSPNIVTRVTCLLAISHSRSIDSVRCLGDSLLDNSLSLEIRDALVRNLARADSNCSLDSIVCDIKMPWGGQSTATWSEIRQDSYLEADQVIKVRHSHDCIDQS